MTYTQSRNLDNMQELLKLYTDAKELAKFYHSEGYYALWSWYMHRCAEYKSELKYWTMRVHGDLYMMGKTDVIPLRWSEKV